MTTPMRIAIVTDGQGNAAACGATWRSEGDVLEVLRDELDIPGAGPARFIRWITVPVEAPASDWFGPPTEAA